MNERREIFKKKVIEKIKQENIKSLIYIFYIGSLPEEKRAIIDVAEDRGFTQLALELMGDM